MRLNKIPNFDSGEPILAVVDHARRLGLTVEGGPRRGMDPLTMLFVSPTGRIVTMTHDEAYRRSPATTALMLLFAVEAWRTYPR